jgi:hypothetical protein
MHELLFLLQPALLGVEAGDVDVPELALQGGHRPDHELVEGHRRIARVTDDDDLQTVLQEALAEPVLPDGDVNRQDQVAHTGQHAADVEGERGVDLVRREDERSEDDRARGVELVLPLTHLLEGDVVMDGIVVDPSTCADLPGPDDRILAHDVGGPTVLVGGQLGDVVLADDLKDLLGGHHHAAAGEPEARLDVDALVDAAEGSRLDVLIEGLLDAGDCGDEVLRADSTKGVDRFVLVVPGLDVQVPSGRNLHKISILLRVVSSGQDGKKYLS